MLKKISIKAWVHREYQFNLMGYKGILCDLSLLGHTFRWSLQMKSYKITAQQHTTDFQHSPSLNTKALYLLDYTYLKNIVMTF